MWNLWLTWEKKQQELHILTDMYWDYDYACILGRRKDEWQSW